MDGAQALLCKSLQRESNGRARPLCLTTPQRRWLCRILPDDAFRHLFDACRAAPNDKGLSFIQSDGATLHRDDYKDAPVLLMMDQSPSAMHQLMTIAILSTLEHHSGDTQAPVLYQPVLNIVRLMDDVMRNCMSASIPHDRRKEVGNHYPSLAICSSSRAYDQLALSLLCACLRTYDPHGCKDAWPLIIV